MGIKDYLRELTLPKLSRPPERPLHLERAVQSLPDFEGKAPAEPPDLNEIENDLRAATASGNLDNVVNVRMLREASWCLWRGNRPWLAENPSFMSFFLDKIRSSPRRSTTRLLIRRYFQEFDPVKPGFVDLTRVILWLVEQWDWEWRHRQREIHLFDTTVGPYKLMERVMDVRQPVSISTALEEVGLKGDLEFCAFASAAFGSALPELGRQLNRDQVDKAWISQLFKWMMLVDSFGRENFRHPEWRKILQKPYYRHSPNENHKKN